MRPDQIAQEQALYRSKHSGIASGYFEMLDFSVRETRHILERMKNNRFFVTHDGNKLLIGDGEVLARFDPALPMMLHPLDILWTIQKRFMQLKHDPRLVHS